MLLIHCHLHSCDHLNYSSKSHSTVQLLSGCNFPHEREIQQLVRRAYLNKQVTLLGITLSTLRGKHGEGDPNPYVTNI